MAPRVWLITGCSSGIGQDLALEVLSRGDKVIATARPRSIAELDVLKSAGADVLELDVTSPPDKIKDTASVAHGIYGRIDVLVNNAGYAILAAAEENSAEDTFQQFNTNIFGAVTLTRAILPYMRAQESGVIIMVGSQAAWTPPPSATLYSSSKAALCAFAEALGPEVEQFGIKVTCVDPGFFRTRMVNANNIKKASVSLAAYDNEDSPARNTKNMFLGKDGAQQGDTRKAAKIICDVVAGTGVAAGKEFPPKLLLGPDCYTAVSKKLQYMLHMFEEWKDITCSTDLDEVK